MAGFTALKAMPSGVLRTHGGGNFGYLPCRRDPEDGHGWRPLAAREDGFATRAAAEAGTSSD